MSYYLCLKDICYFRNDVQPLSNPWLSKVMINSMALYNEVNDSSILIHYKIKHNCKRIDCDALQNFAKSVTFVSSNLGY